MTSVRLHPLLAHRWSPTTFDESHVINAEDLESILDAARWAPSAGNSQPWAFVVGCRGDMVHRRMIRHVTASAVGWASSASVLIANLSHRFVQDTNWDYSEFALYDLGQAVAHMSLQAPRSGWRSGNSALSIERLSPLSSRSPRTGR